MYAGSSGVFIVTSTIIGMTTELQRKKVSLGIPENEPIEKAEKDLDVLTQNVMND